MGSTLHYGVVKWFNDDKGFGFVEGETEDIFVHYSQINKDGYKSLDTGDKVSYDLVETAKGLQAQNITVIKETVGS